MSEAPKRIGICPRYKTWHRDPHETDWNYIRADLVEAAIKRALEGAAERADSWIIWAADCTGSEPRQIAQEIRALDPAQFIEEEKG